MTFDPKKVRVFIGDIEIIPPEPGKRCASCGDQNWENTDPKVEVCPACEDLMAMGMIEPLPFVKEDLK